MSTKLLSFPSLIFLYLIPLFSIRNKDSILRIHTLNALRQISEVEEIVRFSWCGKQISTHPSINLNTVEDIMQ